MNLSSLMTFASFLKKKDPKEQTLLSNYLAEELKQKVVSIDIEVKNPFSLEQTLSSIHPSWFIPFLRTLSQRDIRLFLSCLTPYQSGEIQKALLFTSHRVALTPIATLYLQQTLWKKLTADQIDLLPRSILPISSLSQLLELKNQELLWLLQLLGLHDISAEIRQIIDKARLNLIYGALSESEQNYLKILLQSKEPITFHRIGLASWSGSKEDLKQLIQQRGTNRLAKAIYGQDPSFIWYLCHQMDIDIASSLRRLSTPMDNLTAARLLSSQVLELIAYLREAA